MQNSSTNLGFTGKLNHIGESIFSKMTSLSNQHQAINLSQGFPDFEADAKLIELVDHYIKRGYNQYAPMAGALPLREKLCEIANNQHGCSYHAEKEITITAGATQAIATALAASIREGDEVIVFSPAYDSYIPMIELNGGTAITVKLAHPAYSIDWEQFKLLLNHRTKMIILNTPHNPSGAVWKDADYLKLQEFVGNSNILILADEVYEHIVFNGAQHLSVRSYPTLAERSFVVGSLGKTTHVTGWKVGYCMAPAALMKAFQKLHQFQVFSVNHPIQMALAEYLGQIDLSLIGSFYQKKQQFLEKLIEENTAFKALPSFGSYFQLFDYSEISDKKDIEFTEWLCIEKGVAGIPLSPFYLTPDNNHVLRFCFAKNESTLEAAVERLSKL
jgi:methionine aminotransferase